MAQAHRRSLTGRAAVTVLLWIGFWLMAAAMVGLLAWIPIAQMEHQKGIDFAGGAAGAGAVVLLWTLRPRWWFKKRPIDGRDGLPREAYPALHRFVAEVADKCGAPPADEIQLCDLSTAYIRAEKRHFWSRRRHVVGIGLPLFAFLSRSELGAVLSHEFGHQRGGDLLLTPWVYRTRISLASVLDSLSDSTFFLDLPFRAYSGVFLKASASVSREQELNADEYSAVTYGRRAAFDALRKVRDLGTLWDVYFAADAVPLINRGARLPLLEGFRRFVAESDKRDELPKLIQAARDQRPSPWDSHPPLDQRLAELDPDRARSGATGEVQSFVEDACLDLLGDEAGAEEAWYSRAVTGKPKPLPWEQVASRALLPEMREALTNTPLDPGRAQLEELPKHLKNADAIWPGLRLQGMFLSPQAKRVQVQRRLGDWLALALHLRGFDPELKPGGTLTMRRGDQVVRPRQLVAQLVSGELTEARYLEQCAAWAKT